MHLGAHIGVTAVIHRWGQSIDHHSHVHCIVPGGDCRPMPSAGYPGPGFFPSVRVLSRLCRRLFLDSLSAAHKGGRLRCFSDLAGLQEPATFARHLAPLRRSGWVVYATPQDLAS
jgi:hypothetical protein